MSEVIDNVLSNIKMFEKERYKNMTVIGLNVPNKDLDLMSLEIGLNLGLVKITEIDDNGSVGNVRVVNNAVVPLLILDGEEIVGSKQNRIVNSTIIIPAKSEKIIPVSCVEAGRWRSNSTKFHYSNHMATSRVRRDKLMSVSNSLRKNNSFVSDQNKVWKNIADTQKELNVVSQTDALHDSYSQRSSQMDEYKNAFPLHENQNGLIVYINGELAGLEIIYNSGRYAGYHDKLVGSYILDAISKQDEKYAMGELGEDDLIERIRKTPCESFDSVGLGVDVRLEDDDITGSVMLYEDNLINASFFRKVKA
ncbi:MAG: hypothetical protein BZ135_00825 [Methanosphaera sp. rholeuAM6]|nr:MAG: hypothetical protein BZ135_00825 [Methanosphaera sp. rholeuAM6]